MKKNIALVTGGAGFLGSHLVAGLLKEGVEVHATVREKTNHEFLLNLPEAKHLLKIYTADLLKEGSFTSAISGCNILFHVASPFPTGDANAEKEIIKPAVEGTRNVIKEAIKTPSIEKIILVSSCAAIYCPPLTKEKNVFTEEDWNTTSTVDNFPYFYSKTEAEKVAKQLIDEANKANRNLKFVVINPPLILGPPLNTPETLNSSNLMLVGLTYGGDDGGEGFVYVGDVVNALIKAMHNDKASGRYICSGGSYKFSQITKELAELFPGIMQIEENPESEVMPVFKVDKIVNELGVKFTPLRDMLKITAEDLIAKGYIQIFS